ncbi:phage gp6-like head-tail connector protein [Rhodobacter sp. NTK016B]|uniref:head-tail connector protein n=1 Tax=Rhodobacter sp. NTK016B TaxID=2759676 RepID=UPI001AC7D8FB|nr:head-tail connector protein [Rhodobacter sp. NTK016B]MBN8292822.1 phage gp6-like head-tail connector protein [Rhodobacter sp. NTK016B]
MVELCTLEDVKAAQPVIDYDDDDDMLEILIGAASEAVIDYLDTRAEALLDLDSGGDLVSGATVPAAVRVAAILTTRHLYEGQDDEQAVRGGLPHRAEMLLYRLADPTCT